MKKSVFILSALFFAVAAQAQVAPVVISEVFYDTPLDEHLYADYFGGPYFNGEYVELFNSTGTTVDISGWKLKDGDAYAEFVFPAGSRIAARSTILVAYRHPLSPSFSIRELFPGITPAQEQASVYYHSDIRLTNDGDWLELLTAKGDLVDKVSWLSKRRNKNPRMAGNWTLQADNGEGLGTGVKLQSLQRTNIHASSSKIDFLQGDYKTAEPTPLSIPGQYNLPVLADFYRDGDLDTSLPVGTLPGEASVTPTGAATYRIPIEVPPGTNGWQPQLAIAYNSQGGAGALGQGWDIVGLSVISRGTQSFYYDGDVLGAAAVQFDDRDRLYMDGQRLVLLSGTYWGEGSVYGFEQENQVRVTLKKNSTGVYFKADYPGGAVVEYGNTADSRVRNAANADDSRTLAWKAAKATDAHGNEILYTYTGNGMYVSAVEYTGGENKLAFHYALSLKNSRKRYIKDFLTEQYCLLNAIDVQCGGRKVRTYTFGYTTSDTDQRLENIGETVDGVKLNATKIEWGEETSIQRVDLGARQDRTLAEAKATIHTGDVDGDGYPDLIEMWEGNNSEDGHFCARLYNKNTGKFNQEAAFVHNFPYNNEDSPYTNRLALGNITGDEKTEIVLLNRGILEVYSYENGNLKKISEKDTRSFVGYSKKRYYNIVIANVNNDIYNDIILLNNFSSEEKGFWVWRHTNVLFYPEFHILYGSNMGLDLSIPPTSVKTNVKSCLLTIGNFNSDGKINFFMSGEGVYGKQGLIDEAPCFSWVNADWNLSNRRNVIPADFNGDGITDILAQNGQNYLWFIKQGTPDVLRPVSFEYRNMLPNISDATGQGKERDACYVVDYNGDGLPDIIIGDETWTGGIENAIFNYTTWYFYKNTGKGFIQEYRISKDKKRMSRFYGFIADMNGDGVQDLVLSEGDDNTNYFYFTKPDTYKRNLVHKITNGLGQLHKFTYKTYSEYDQTATAGPVRNLKAPLPVVAEHISPANLTTTYAYKDGKVHRHKGFLGFLNMTAKNGATQTETRSTYGIDPASYALLPQKQEILIAGNLVTTTEQQHETVVLNASGKRFLTRTKREKVTDHLKDIAQQTDYAYTDASGTNVSKTIKLLNGNVVSVTEYFDYASYKNKDLPGRVKATARRTGQDDITAETVYEYNAQGLVAKKTEYPGTAGEVVTEYNYLPEGNMKTVRITPKDCEYQLMGYSYDGRARFVTVTRNRLAQRTYADYDPATGNVLSESGIDGLKTVYEYDERGQLIKTTYPNGETVAYSRSWCDEHGATYKTETYNEQLKKRTVTYHDHLGRTVYTEQTGADGSLLASSQTYNAIGQVVRSVPLHAADEPERYTEYEYDAYGRVLAEKHYDGENTLDTRYSYAGRRTTVLHPDGTRSSATEDEAGRVIHREDEGGVINYEYNAAGQPVSIASNGTTTRIAYDAFGRQTALHDPDAGIMRYRYNAAGQLLSQVNARGDSTIFAYDRVGRPESEITYARQGAVRKAATTYLYVESGNGIGQPDSITHREDHKVVHTQSFTYNAHHQPETVTDTYEGRTYMFRYGYDALWRPETTTSPSGLVVTNEYDDRGNVVKVKAGSTVVWELAGQTAHGQITSFRQGSQQETTHEYYANGLLKKQRARNISTGATLQHMEYEYAPDTYSLTRRNNVKQNRDEHFSYDELDRLTAVIVNNRVMPAITYQANGNIDWQPGVGTYLYDDARPHALSGIKDGTAGSGLTGIEQEISYTAFNKVSSVQHHGGNNIISRARVIKNNCLKNICFRRFLIMFVFWK